MRMRITILAHNFQYDHRIAPSLWILPPTTHMVGGLPLGHDPLPCLCRPSLVVSRRHYHLLPQNLPGATVIWASFTFPLGLNVFS